MPNWCSNSLTFSGKNVSIAKEMFDELVKKYKRGDGSGVKPDMIAERAEGPNPYMFELRSYDSDLIEDATYYYDTKWSPNVEDIAVISRALDCDFKMYYEELGCGIYGYTEMVNGVTKIIDLEDEDMDEINYDEEKDTYLFRGQEWESSEECYETLLAEKITASLSI